MDYKSILESNIFKDYFNLNIVYSINCIYSELDKNTNKYGYINNNFMKLINGTEINKEDLISINMNICCFEILQRLYLAATTGFLRFYNWLNGLEYSLSSDNIIIFASSLRGLIESSCDLYDALENIPLNLAEYFSIFKCALEGELRELYSPKEFEDKLIHFQNASNKNKNMGNGSGKNIYNPKSARDYITSINLKHLNLYKCYSELCEMTHPAEDSLSVFIHNKDNILSINTNSTYKIKSFISSYSGELKEMFERTFNLLIIIFKTVNLFEIEELTLKYPEQVDCTSILMWNKIKEKIKEKSK